MISECIPLGIATGSLHSSMRKNIMNKQSLNELGFNLRMVALQHQ
jgi:hypothetical protein